MSRRRPAYAAGVVAALVSLTLTACGDDTPDAPPTGAGATPTTTPTTPSATPPAPQSAAPTPSAAESAGSAGSGTPAAGTPLAEDELAEVVAAGFDPEQGADLTVQNDLALLSGVGRIAFGTDPAALEMALTSSETGDGEPIGVLVADDVLYLADGERYLGVEVDAAANPFGAAFTDQLDPRAVLAAVQASYRSARDLGPMPQDGIELDTYEVAADGSSTLDAIAPDLAEQPGSVVPAEVTAQVGVDADGLVRRVRVDLGAENGTLAYSLDGWGPEVTVVAPPPGRVDDLDLPG